jgi:hypothetical protein
VVEQVHKGKGVIGDVGIYCRRRWVVEEKGSREEVDVWNSKSQAPQTPEYGI